MRGENPPNSHELAKLECKLKFLYFLRDLGLRTAIPASTEAFIEYMEKISELLVIEATDVS
jgi:hypothetical protein